MLRVIRSTIQGTDINTDLEEQYEDAINNALKNRAEVRETYSLDQLSQKEARIALLPYTDPQGANRWAILDESPAEIDWQDTDNLDEAIATYEEWVRATTDGTMPKHDDEGNELPIWDSTDVNGVSAKETYDSDAANAAARMIDAQWADDQFTAVEQVYQHAKQRRQLAFARCLNSFGRGGQAMLAKRVGLKEPTVKAIADKGRTLLAEQP